MHFHTRLQLTVSQIVWATVLRLVTASLGRNCGCQRKGKKHTAKSFTIACKRIKMCPSLYPCCAPCCAPRRCGPRLAWHPIKQMPQCTTCHGAPNAHKESASSDLCTPSCCVAHCAAPAERAIRYAHHSQLPLWRCSASLRHQLGLPTGSRVCWE